MMATRAPTRPVAGPSAGTRSRVLQRCSCGGKPGPSGECAECRRKRRTPGLQPKLRVSQPGDRWEREADRVAASVGRMPPGDTMAAPILQRLQGGSSRAGMEAPPIVDQVLAAPGRPLDEGTRAAMEGRLGHDFSRVRIHEGGRAADSALAVGARAYTVGTDVVFAPGEYAPGTQEGRGLLAHELTHVVQQGGTEAAGSPGAEGQLQRGWPVIVGVGAAIAALAWCIVHHYNNAWDEHGDKGDKWLHCYVSCKIAAWCPPIVGGIASFGTGALKEALDYICDVLGYNCAAEWEDFVADLEGIACGYSFDSCEDCCDEARPS